MKWMIGPLVLVAAGCADEGSDLGNAGQELNPYCDFAQLTSDSHDSVLLLGNKSEQVCVQLVLAENTSSQALLQFNMNQSDVTAAQDDLTLLYWTKENQQDKYWAYANELDYILNAQSDGSFELNAFDAEDNLRFGPIVLWPSSPSQ